ncbi:MAG: MoaD/ThiS family protein [Chloroflexota bacterium]
MPAYIRPIGVLKSFIGDKPEAAVEPGRTLRQTIAELGIPVDKVAMVLVNDAPQPKDYILQDGDIARLIMAVSGG